MSTRVIHKVTLNGKLVMSLEEVKGVSSTN